MSEQCVILNDIHIDIMDYIKPASCSEARVRESDNGSFGYLLTSFPQFRSMWTEFEWENRVSITSSLTDPRAYLRQVMSTTNMGCLTPEGALSGDCDFLSANLYARSLFGQFLHFVGPH